MQKIAQRVRFLNPNLLQSQLTSIDTTTRSVQSREITSTRELRNAFDKYKINVLSRYLNWTSGANDNHHAASYVVNRHFRADNNGICTKEFSSKVQLI